MDTTVEEILATDPTDLTPVQCEQLANVALRAVTDGYVDWQTRDRLMELMRQATERALSNQDPVPDPQDTLKALIASGNKEAADALHASMADQIQEQNEAEQAARERQWRKAITAVAQFPGSRVALPLSSIL